MAAVDGFITYPDPSLLLPAVPETGKGVVVGDTYLEEQTDGFLRFGHPAIPSGSTIVSATMVVYQELVVGTPFADLGGFVAADHVFIGAYLGDPSAAMIQAAFGVVSTDAGVGPRTLDVTAQVQLDVDANRATSDFVLRFPAWTDVDSSTDAVLFTDAENFYGSGTPPTLLVTWR